MEKFTSRAHAWLRRHAAVRTAVIVLLVFLSAFEFDAIVRGLRDPYLAEDLSVQYENGRLTRQRDIAKPEEIEAWMTFQYVNFLFALPPHYLEGTLGLNDEKYPKVQIARYARTRDLPLDSFLREVQDAVKDYVERKP